MGPGDPLSWEFTALNWLFEVFMGGIALVVQGTELPGKEEIGFWEWCWEDPKGEGTRVVGMGGCCGGCCCCWTTMGEGACGGGIGDGGCGEGLDIF